MECVPIAVFAGMCDLVVVVAVFSVGLAEVVDFVLADLAAVYVCQ